MAVSDNQQHKFREILFGDDLVWIADNSRHFDQVPVDDPQRKELKSKLAKRVLALADEQLTERQLQVFKGICLEGKTQWELATELGLKSQTTIHKILMGNLDYTYTPARRFGGVRKKLLKAMAKDDQCQQWLNELQGTEGETWSFRLPPVPTTGPHRKGEDET